MRSSATAAVVAAGRLAADDIRPSELGLGVLEQPPRDRDTVVGTGRVGVLGRQAVVDRHDRDAEVAQVDVADVVHLGRAEHHAPPWKWR